MGLFDEYKNYPDKDVRERANNWGAAIGLQNVDGLNVSEFLIQLSDSKLRAKSRWMKLHKDSMSIMGIVNFIVQPMRLFLLALKCTNRLKRKIDSAAQRCMNRIQPSEILDC